MKKLFLTFIILFCILILLPTLISLSFSEAPRRNNAKINNLTISVFHAETGEIKEESLEAYLSGVVAAEMPASFHEEALRAQAVAARTYIYYKMNDEERNTEHPDASVCTDSSHCKAWKSDDTLKSEMGMDWYENDYPKIQKAVEVTSGEIMTYEEEPILAVFHSTGSGRTENAEDVWGGLVPYLKSVESPGDSMSPKFSSTVTVAKTEICEKLQINDPIVGTIHRSQGGAVLSVDIGGMLFKGTEIRSIFSLNSSNFEIENTENDFIFHVKGNGHGVGMSQYGANAMAESGKTYQEILSSYYTGIQFSKI